MALYNTFRTPAGAGVTVQDIVNQGNTPGLLLANINTGGSKFEALFLNPEQAAIVLGGGDNLKIAASTTTALSDIGDSFTFDLSVLAPPPVGEKVITEVLESGVSGDLLAQAAEIDYLIANTGGSREYTIGAVANGYAWIPPREQNQDIMRYNLNTKSMDIIPGLNTSTVKGITGIGVIENKVVCVAGSSTPTDYYVINSLDSSFITVSIAAISERGWSGRGYIYDGKLYFYPNNGRYVLEFDPDTDTFSEFTAAGNFGPISGNKFDGTTGYGSRIYSFPRSYSTNSAFYYDFDTASAGSVPLGSNGYIRPIKVGRFAYLSPLSATGILKYDLENDTFTTIGSVTGLLEGAYLEAENKIYYPTTGSDLHILDLSDDSLETVTPSTPLDSVVATTSESIINAPPTTGGYFVDLYLKNKIYSPSAPGPFHAVENIYIGSTVQRIATPNEDYTLKYNKTGSDITSIEVIKLKPGTADVTLNVLYTGF